MPKRNSLNLQIGLFVAIRTIINTAYRMVYPLLPVFARGLGVDLTALSYSLSARSTFGLVSILFAPLADRFGRRLSMLLALVVFSLGASVVIALPTFTGFVLAMILTNLGMQIFIAPMQSYLADRVPYERLGRAMGLTEISWALAFVLGIPAVTWLMARSGWASSFVLLAGLGVVCLVLLLALIPSDRPARDHVHAPLWSAFGTVLRSPVALLALVFNLFTTVANESINVVFGLWMENSFGLQLAALGASSVIIGLSEIGGSGSSAWLADRLGKERAVALGLLTNSLAAAALPLLGSLGLTGALAGLFLFYLTFEFTLVSTLPLMSELVPAARATMMALVSSAFAAGRAVGALVAPVFFGFGLWGNALAAVALNLIALLLLRWIHPPRAKLPASPVSG